MQITLEADYAVRIMTCLAKNARRIDAKFISEQTDVTLRFSLKILRKLVAKGLVVSFKGVQGGYELAKPSKDISLYSIIETVEGSFAMSRCLHPEFVCSQNTHNGTSCKVQKVYDEISTVVKEKMEAVSLEQIADGSCCKG